MVKYQWTVLQAISLTIMLYSCENKTVEPRKSNEITAKIVEVNPGLTLDFKATGSNTMMECDIYNISTFISGTDVNNANATIQISVTQCVINEGGYGIDGYYDRSKVGEAYDPDFTSKQNGSITFNRVDGKYMEGSFNVVLYCVFPYNNCDEKDSVIISGSFKGDRTH